MTAPRAQLATRPLPEGLEAFAAEATGMNSGRLRSLLTNLPAAFRNIERCLRPEEGGITRRELVRSPEVLLVLAGMEPGHSEAPHDHPGSLSAFRVLRGVAVVTRFGMDDRGSLVVASLDTYLPGSVLVQDETEVRSLGNDRSAAEALVTLHVYLPAPAIRIYTEGGVT
ncbi:MAG: hypothetical protein KF866_00055 [Phycisphaeraceae bacterium]|nr:hypothetical protein [Phycisphaeraceae bacterium]